MWNLFFCRGMNIPYRSFYLDVFNFPISKRKATYISTSLVFTLAVFGYKLARKPGIMSQ